MTVSSTRAESSRSDYRISSVVMTHPARLAQASALAERLGCDHVVTDPEPASKPSPLRTAMAAWSTISPDATHHLLLQDDVLPADDFMAQVRSAVEQRPHDAISFYANWQATNGAYVRIAAISGISWVQALENEYTPTLAIVLPREHALGYAEFAHGHLSREAKDDDEVLKWYLLKRGLSAYISVPNLVEHIGDDSISGNSVRGIRRSACFVPDFTARLSLDRPPLRPTMICPYVRRGYLNVSTPRRGNGRAFLREPWLGHAEPLGLTDRELTGRFLRHAGARSRAIEPVARYYDGRYAVALWMAAFLTGFQIGRHRLATVDSIDVGSPLFDMALRTMVLGGPEPSLRGVAPAAVLDSALEYLTPAVLAGVERADLPAADGWLAALSA